MAFKYFIEPSSHDSHQSDPYWIAVIEPFSYRETFNRDFSNPGSLTIANNDPVKTDDVIVIDSDCVAWQCSTNKSDPTTGLQMTLKHSTINYALKVAPEDWIMFWAFDNFADYQMVKSKIAKFERVTHFKTAPKFIGRVSSVFVNKQIDTSSGKRDVTYTLQANGFTELTAKIYYNPQLHQTQTPIFNSQKNFGNEVDRIFFESIIPISVALRKMISILLGMGPGKDFTRPGGLIASPNEAYLIPKSMSRFITGSVYGQLFYSDILNPVLGVQKYDRTANLRPTADLTNPYLGFSSDVEEFRSVLVTPNINFNNNPFWSILMSISGFPVNELYTCLRVDEDGHVKPTVVCRQLPFSSKKFASKFSNSTQFLSLPRWIISDKLITRVSTGRSNSSRFNYIQVIGSHPEGEDEALKQANAYNIFRPIFDSADIKRAGLNTKIQNVGMYYTPVNSKSQAEGRFWNNLMADVLFGSHLKYSGSITTSGIQAPICEGDNCVIDGILYHIEGLDHLGSIDASGRKTFTTNLTLSNGIAEVSDDSSDIIYPDSPKNTFRSGHVGLNYEVE